jgi:hypothetical protein
MRARMLARSQTTCNTVDKCPPGTRRLSTAHHLQLRALSGGQATGPLGWTRSMSLNNTRRCCFASSTRKAA